MKNTALGVSTVFMALGLSLVARPASAKVEVSIFSLHDRLLSANFEDASSDGCSVTQTAIRFNESVTLQTGDPPVVEPPTTSVEIDYANGCTGEFFTLTGGTPQQTFHIAPDLRSATLEAVVPVADADTGANGTEVTLNVTFTANAPLQKGVNDSVTHGGGVLTVTRDVAEVRTADVSGTVAALLTVLDDQGQATPTDFDLSLFPEGGQLGKDADGTRTVTVLRRGRGR